MSKEEKRKALLETLNSAEDALISAELELDEFVGATGESDVASMQNMLKGYRFIIRESFIARINAGDYDDKETT